MTIFGSHVSPHVLNIRIFDAYEGISRYMSVYEGIWKYMRVYGCIWRYVKVYGVYESIWGI